MTGVRENMDVGFGVNSPFTTLKTQSLHAGITPASSQLRQAKTKHGCVSSCRTSGLQDRQQERLNVRRCWR